MVQSKFENYLYDLGFFLKEKAKDAKKSVKTASDSEDVAYQEGYVMAYFEVIDLMKQQAKAFNIAEKDIGLADIDPERDLL